MKCIIIGAGGHGKVIADILSLDNNIECIGFIDDNKDKQGKKIIYGLRVIGKLSQIEEKVPKEIKCICAIGHNYFRRKIFNKLTDKGYDFINAIHPTAYISKDAKLGKGISICGHAFVGPGSILGNNIIVNTSASIDHDNIIKNHAQITPGVHLGGDVTIGENVMIGLGANVIQKINIGEYSLIGAGAVVVKDIPPKSLCVGIPAKQIKELKEEDI